MVDVVALTPKQQDQPYSGAVIWVDRNAGVVRRIDITEASGQQRTVILGNLKVNRGAPGREFTFSPPAGVRVVDQYRARPRPAQPSLRPFPVSRRPPTP